MRVAIFEEAGAAPALQEAEHTPLQDNEVLVRIAGVGVCHTDLTGLNGNVPLHGYNEMPFLFRVFRSTNVFFLRTPRRFRLYRTES